MVFALTLSLSTRGSAVATDTQTIAPDPATVNAVAGQTVQFDVGYTTSTADATLTGLGLRIHFDSRRLGFQGTSDVLATGRIALQDPVADGPDFDGDPATDRFVLVAWADINGNWPGQVPTRLLRIAFQTAPDFSSQTILRFSASSTAAGYAFASTPAVIGTVAAPTSTETPVPATTTRTPTRTVTPTLTGTVQPATPTTTVARPTPTPTTTQTPNATPPAACPGDCDGDAEVTIDELITMVNIALGTRPVQECTRGDGDGDGEVTIDEIILGVNAALNTCGGLRPTPTATPRFPILRVSTVSGQPGEDVPFAVTLDTVARAVGGFQGVVSFDPFRIPVVAGFDGGPDCTGNPGLGSEFGFAWRPGGCVATDCSAVFAVAYPGAGVSLLPDGEVYRCTVRIAADAPPGSYSLTISDVVITDADGSGIPGAAGTNGAVVVLPGPAGTPTVRPTPTMGR